MINKNSVYILGVEAKDVYGANHLVNKNNDGYCIRNKNGDINLNKFVNELAYSIDLMEMRSIYEKVYRKRNFSFKSLNKEYTQEAIVVDFKYSYKEFNKVSTNIYIRSGYLYQDIKNEFVDCVCIKDDKLCGIKINEETPQTKGLTIEMLTDSFIYQDGMYKLIKEPKCLLNKCELREKLYLEGFFCDGIKYIRDKRSSGSSRVGKCLFIDENLYQHMLKWEKCGLNIKDGDLIDLAAFESYISLPASSCIDTMEIRPENFLVIDDYDSSFTDEIVAVEYKDDSLVSSVKKRKIKNSIFDGQSIMDESLFLKYPTRSMLLLRSNFFKSACFKGKVQQWFKDNNITEISQLNGKTIAKNISDIKIITTPSSIKYLKFGTLMQWFKNVSTAFGIVKYEKPTHYLEGNMVQCHYQLLNTLQLSKKDVDELVEPSLDYIRKIRNDPAVLRYHIKYPHQEMKTITPLRSKNEIIFKLLGINNNFCKTKMYYDFRNDLVKSMISNLKEGHILINGNYSTLFGNGIEMLQHSIGKFKGQSVIGKGNISSKRFAYNQKLLASRSPHINSGNVLLANNVQNDLIDTYFNLSEEIVYVNSIGENILQRLNGADFDSDAMLLTDNQILINAAEKNYDKFKVPTCLVEAKKTQRLYTAKDKCDLDVKTSGNKIGEIVNLSQLLNSIMWENINNGQTISQNSELYEDICKLAVLSGIEIDKAKKEFDVNSGKEIKKIKQKYQKIKDGKIEKPMFFKMITLNNGYKLNSKHHYRYFKTPMDFLQEKINQFNFREGREQKRKDKILPFSDIIKPVNYNVGLRQYEKKHRIMKLITDLKSEIDCLYIDYDKKNKSEKEIIKQQVSDIKQQVIEYINDISTSDSDMYLILKEIDTNKKCSRLIMNTLFATPNESFFEMIQKNSNEIQMLKRDLNGEITLYGYNYTKIQVEK